MAQTIKLKRSSTAGKVPGTGNLALGELAINTYDGRIFFKKNDGSDAVEHIVTTDSITTGSISLTSKVTAATLTLSGLSAQSSEATSLMINGSGVVGTRELGSNAFNSTAYATGDNFDSDGTFASLRAQGTTKGDVGLGNVENTAISTFAGSSNITTVGTIGTGTWQGTAIADAYLSSNTAHLSGTQTFTGQKTFSSGSAENTNFQNNIRAYNTILMANESSTNRWQIVNNYSGQLLEDNSFGLRYHNGSNWSGQVFNLSTSGDIEATGDVVAYASSDERYKDNVTPIENPNDKIKQIGGYTFDWNDKHEIFKGQHDVGVIAQEIEKVLPEIVQTRESGYKAVKYEKLVALLIESNKELLKRVEELESKIK